MMTVTLRCIFIMILESCYHVWIFDEEFSATQFSITLKYLYPSLCGECMWDDHYFELILQIL